MNFHPSAAANPPGPTTPEPFAPEALYELKVDTNGDAVADITYQMRVSPSKDAGHTATLRRLEGLQAAQNAEVGKIIADRVPVSMEREAQVTQAGDTRFFVGRRSDPFFFDVLGTLNNFQFTGDDFFADKNICSIALEVPNAALGPNEVGLWVRTLLPADGAAGRWVQVERGARSSQTPFLAGEQNDAYLAGEPADDVRFIPVFAHALEHTGGYGPEEAKRAAETMLPDLVRYDPRRPASYPDNGRALTDDVSDYFLGILTNGKVTEDKVGPHGDLLDEFPYLGPPHD
jgi:hypothetical protein